MRAFFTIRTSWAWTRGHAWFGDGKDKWPWLEHAPQVPGWHEAPDKPECIPVSPSQHVTNNIGRSFVNSRQPAPAGNPSLYRRSLCHQTAVDPDVHKRQPERSLRGFGQEFTPRPRLRDQERDDRNTVYAATKPRVSAVNSSARVANNSRAQNISSA